MTVKMAVAEPMPTAKATMASRAMPGVAFHDCHAWEMTDGMGARILTPGSGGNKGRESAQVRVNPRWIPQFVESKIRQCPCRRLFDCERWRGGTPWRKVRSQKA